MKDYYNTNKESGQMLLQSREKAKTQQYMVLEYFRFHPTKWFTVYEVWCDVLVGSPYSSAVRTVSNLTHAGHLEKGDREQMVMGMYGKIVHRWRLRA